MDAALAQVTMHPLAKLDHRFVWHPFTQMRDWLKREPLIIVEGRGAALRDVKGRQFLDANSSIWTNLHGHQQPAINAAIRAQLKKIAHSSALGLANEPASRLAARLVEAASPHPAVRRSAGARLNKVFFSDDGSTALEVALKLAHQFSRRSGRSQKPRFISMEGGYHGDTIGAVALGHIDLFHGAYSQLLFKTDQVMAPYCYRCRFNRARPQRADAREYRRCNWECVARFEQKFERGRKRGKPYSAFVFEPLIQGAAGMIPQPKGWLSRVAEIARGHKALLIADEVMTGFGRTGFEPDPFSDPVISARAAGSQKIKCGTRSKIAAHGNGGTPARGTASSLFASHQENVQPDLLALAKGLSGGYLPLAATLTTQSIFDAFLGEYDEFKTFFHGHSFTGNQLGAAAALANLDLLQQSICARQELQRLLTQELRILWRLRHVGDIRQVGLIAGIELVRDWRTRAPFKLAERAGMRVCDAMAQRGVLTRPIGNVIVLMPPYCTTPDQLQTMVAALEASISEVLGP